MACAASGQDVGSNPQNTLQAERGQAHFKSSSLPLALTGSRAAGSGCCEEGCCEEGSCEEGNCEGSRAPLMEAGGCTLAPSASAGALRVATWSSVQLERSTSPSASRAPSAAPQWAKSSLTSELFASSPLTSAAHPASPSGAERSERHVSVELRRSMRPSVAPARGEIESFLTSKPWNSPPRQSERSCGPLPARGVAAVGWSMLGVRAWARALTPSSASRQPRASSCSVLCPSIAVARARAPGVA